MTCAETTVQMTKEQEDQVIFEMMEEDRVLGQNPEPWDEMNR